MRRFEFKEPYPVYRGFFVPLKERGEFVCVRRVKNEDVELFQTALDKLRNLLQNVSNISRDVKTIADAIALFFKAPLIQDISPTSPSPLKAYALHLLLPPREYSWGEDIYEFAKNLAKLERQHFQKVEVLFDPEVAEIVEKLWLYFPADTRPGYNTSSLIAHSLLTSAIAWAIEVENGNRSKEVEFVRMASLLHDFGKAVDPKNHYKASEDIARFLLKDILDDEELEKLAKIIREHHIKVRESIKRADKLASAVDRLEEIVKSTIGEFIDLREKDKWEYWERLYEEKGNVFEELTKRIIEGEKRAAKEESEGKLKLFLVDFGGIQDFVYRSQEIRSVTMASHLVDLAVHAHILYYLNLKLRVTIPPEAVVYSGGGNLMFILPSSLVEDVKKTLGEYEEMTGFKLFTSETTFSTNYTVMREKLEENMAKNKHTVELTDNFDYSDVKEKCELCYEWQSKTTKIPTAEGEKKVCNMCKELYEAGSKVHFKSRWKAKINVAGREFSAEEVFGRSWDEVNKFILEIIAGHNPEDFLKAELEQTLKDMAVVKFDGNLMGSFMSEAVSFTDAIERSFRVDMAVKKAYRKAIETVYRAVAKHSEDEAKRNCLRIFLGTVYIGGDDGLIILPSWLALPFAALIAEEFNKQLGGKRGLSVGIMAGPAKMNIWSLIDCSDTLMKFAKEHSRKTSCDSAFCFFAIDSGSPSGKAVKEILKNYSGRMSLQPVNKSELLKILSLMSENEEVDYERVIELAYSALNGGSGWLNSLRNTVLEDWNAVQSFELRNEVFLVYLHRQRERMKEKSKIYEKLLDFVRYACKRTEKTIVVPVLDILLLYKFVKGGKG